MSLWRKAGRVIVWGVVLFLLWIFAVWPPPVWFRSHYPNESAFMRMRRGQADSSTPERRYRPIPLDSIAKAVPRAVTIGEDDDFWNHDGIDYRSLRHALGYKRDSFSWSSPRDRKDLMAVLGRAWERREALRGASTITQQLAKNLYLSPSRNPLRKLKEAVTAYRLETALGKERILELYLNLVELGDEVWGVEAASQKYFHRPARQLSIEQAAALAGALPFPLSSNPGYRPGRMRWRQNLILRRMRGENVEVPKVETEVVLPVVPDTGALIPEEPVPLDTVPAPLPFDSVITPPDSSIHQP
ncbi:MAG TPA: biosynthetic peptidoglycan transglycosylase [Gemmatimonadales bacterium]|nr:biosynthetic peptidoglycan transglycosylase [Gemmatimonadales bacterium]